MKKPNLFILGAPKCGTTAIATWLGAHADVYLSPVKEPHFFGDEYRLTSTLGAYESLFALAKHSHKWVCEASVWYLLSDSALPNILSYAPDARFIVMVRNPVDMAASLHKQQVFNGNELVSDFSKALSLNTVRRRGEHASIRPGYLCPAHLAYLDSCALGRQVERVIHRVASDRLHVIFFDDLAANPKATFLRLLDFLDLSVSLPSTFAKINPAKERRFPLLDALALRAARIKKVLGVQRRLHILSTIRRKNVRYRARTAIPQELRRRMIDEFMRDVALLGRLTNRDLSSWTATSPPENR